MHCQDRTHPRDTPPVMRMTLSCFLEFERRYPDGSACVCPAAGAPATGLRRVATARPQLLERNSRGRRLDLYAGQDLEPEIEFLVNLVLPLLDQVAMRDD